MLGIGPRPTALICALDLLGSTAMTKTPERDQATAAKPPILRGKHHDAPSVFQPDGLLREARRQKGIADQRIPELCVLDPDGDILRFLLRRGDALRLDRWACYHSDMHVFESAGRNVGLVACAVGAPYAVLVAEQMFASGCRLLVSITSSGELKPLGPRPYFVLVEQALRDEGTSYHYLPAGEFAAAEAGLLERVHRSLSDAGPVIHKGRTWTTDAPFRETGHLLDKGREMGLAAIEMESAALYALAQVRGVAIICLAHVTNVMAVAPGDFEKGEGGGAVDALRIVEAISTAFEDILA